MRELNHFVLGKGPFASVKGHIFFTKKALRQSRGAGGGRNLLNRKLFLNSLIEIKKSKIFFKKGTFNKASNPRMLYLSKIGPEKKERIILNCDDHSSQFLNIYLQVYCSYGSNEYKVEYIT